MRAAVVINSASGSALGRDDLEEQIAAALARSGLDVVIMTEADGDLDQRLQQAVECGAGVVVVGGGDGTLAAAAHKLAGKDVSLGIIPLGTMNRLAKDLGIPTAPDAAVAVLADGAGRRIDVGEVNGRTFLRNSVLGFPSRLAARREGLRGRIGLRDHWRLAVALLRQLTRYPTLPLTLRIAGERRRLHTRMLAVANNAYEEGFGRVLTRASLERGELVLYTAPEFGIGMFLRLAFGMMLGTWRGIDELETRSLQHMVVGSPRRRLRVMNDGEPLLLETPLRYRIRPAALRVLVPRGDPDGSVAASDKRAHPQTVA